VGKEPIDWETIHSRLNSVGVAIASGNEPGPEEKRRILKKRAEMLARGKASENDDDSLAVVEFLLANERYGIETRYIREVYPLKDFTPLPGVPPFVLGLVNVRGKILSVIDIKKFFDLPDKGISELNTVIIVHNDTMEFGILADAIAGVSTIPVRTIGPPLPTLTGIRGEYLRGVTEGRMVVLDAARILSDRNIVVEQHT
jgi:purine-binding chemotaxis protein CheW